MSPLIPATVNFGRCVIPEGTQDSETPADLRRVLTRTKYIFRAKRQRTIRLLDEFVMPVSQFVVDPSRRQDASPVNVDSYRSIETDFPRSVLFSPLPWSVADREGQTDGALSGRRSSCLGKFTNDERASVFGAAGVNDARGKASRADTRARKHRHPTYTFFPPSHAFIFAGITYVTKVPSTYPSRTPYGKNYNGPPLPSPPSPPTFFSPADSVLSRAARSNSIERPPYDCNSFFRIAYFLVRRTNNLRSNDSLRYRYFFSLDKTSEIVTEHTEGKLDFFPWTFCAKNNTYIVLVKSSTRGKDGGANGSTM